MAGNLIAHISHPKTVSRLDTGEPEWSSCLPKI